MSLNFTPLKTRPMIECMSLPVSGDRISPTSSCTSRIAPLKLSSPLSTEPPTHSHIRERLDGQRFAEKSNIRLYCCESRHVPQDGSILPVILCRECGQFQAIRGFHYINPIFPYALSSMIEFYTNLNACRNRISVQF